MSRYGRTISHNVGRVGIISDTHGLVRPEAITALEGSELILHAGDIGRPEVLERLVEIAPVIAVRGNNDKAEWAADLSETELVQIGNTQILLIHDIKELKLAPEAAGIRIIVSGHSHKPVIRREHRLLFVNPGSAGPRRFKLPVSVARLELKKDEVNAEIVHLEL